MKLMRDGMIVALMGVLALAALAPTPAPAPQDPDGFKEFTDASQKAIEKGLEWLRKIQARDHGWGCEKGAPTAAAITGLAGLSFLGQGSTPGNGPYSREITGAIEWAMKKQKKPTGVISTGMDVTGIGVFFEHAAITLFLAEAYGMMPTTTDESGFNNEVRKTLEAAIEYLDKQQGDDGGWSANGRGSASDIAITSCVYSALRSAHNAGITVDGADIEKVDKFCDKCRIGGGGFQQYPTGGGRGMFYPSSAGLRIKFGMGRGNNVEHVQKTIDMIVKHTIGSEYGGQISEWDYLAAFYATQALIQENGPNWKKWYPKIREYLIKKQNGDGSWTVEYCMSCRAYATALSLLILEAPMRVLPMWQL